MKTPNYVFDDELYHHGIEGQKWRIRRYQNEDGTYTEEGKERRRNSYYKYGGKGETAPLTKQMQKKLKKGSHDFLETDYVIKKGTKYERFTKNKNEKFKDKIYVGHNALKYAQALIKKSGDYYIDKLETKRDTIIAGQDTMLEILKNIGGKDAKLIMKSIDSKRTLFDKDGDPYLDFLYKDKYKIADKFINELKNKGYDGIPDPYDSFINKDFWFDIDATIFVNDVLKRTDQEKREFKIFKNGEKIDDKKWKKWKNLMSEAKNKEKKITKKGGHK